MIAGGAVRPVRRRFFVEMRLGRDEAAICSRKDRSAIVWGRAASPWDPDGLSLALRSAIAADFGRKTILERKPGNAHGRLIEVFPVEEPQQSDRIRSVSER